jgi:hypothetical protein
MTINVPPNMSRQSATQMGAEVARLTASASRRNG